MKILLIAGHGAGDLGVVAVHGGKTYRECDETRLLAASVAGQLRQRGLEAEVYPPEENAFARCRAGKLKAEADVAVELHFNAASYDPGNGKPKGTECWLPSDARDETLALALCAAMNRLDFPNRGVKRKDFAVISRLRRMGIPAVLLEVCFLDDADDMALYEACRALVPAAICDAICQAFRVETNWNAAMAARRAVQEKAGLSDATMEYLAAYRWGEELLQKLAAAME